MGLALTWNDSFLIGHAKLDYEHRAMLDCINAIHAECTGTNEPSRMRTLLDGLIDAARRHFELEDKVLRELLVHVESGRVSFPSSMNPAAIVEHVEQHNRDLAFLELMRTEQGLAESLPHWFVNHAIKHDAQLKSVFQAIERDCPALLQQLV